MRFRVAACRGAEDDVCLAARQRTTWACELFQDSRGPAEGISAYYRWEAEAGWVPLSEL